MWDENDKVGYILHQRDNKGQIVEQSEFANDIETYAKNPSYKTFLEIGTWNGLGSTKSFVRGFGERDDYLFYSLECNRDKHRDAKELYRSNTKVHILNEVIWKEIPSDFYKIFPCCLENRQFKYWNEIDMANMKACPLFLDRPDLPKVFDVILLDGGEFTTYYDFQCLKNRCKILMLDDIYTNKCQKIVQEIRDSPEWTILKIDNARNGHMICERILEPIS
jgi:hypothetical protein